MAPLDTDALVREISPDAPCGLDPTESIEGSAFQQDLDRLLDATTRGDASDLGFGWEQIAERGIELFGSGKDLRIATTLALCGLHREGLGGFADGVALVRELLERYWDAVHPVPNTFESFPFEDRVFALKNLQRDELLQSLRTVPIVRSSFGQCSYRDYQVSTGAIAAGEAEDGPTISPDDIAVVMGSIGIDGLGELRGHIDRIDAELTSIQSFVDARVPEASLQLELLTAMLDKLRDFIAQQSALLGGDTAATPSAEPGTAPTSNGAPAPGVPAPGVTGEIRSRDDVIRTIDRLCAYYQHSDIGSPVPLLLQRARRMVSKSFVDILADLAPEGLDQATNVLGVERESEED